MKFFSRFLLFASSFLLSLNLVAQDRPFRADPPSWWTGMENTGLQLMLYGDKIGETSPVINYPGVTLLRTTRLENPDYLVVYLDITPEAKPGKVPIVFEYQREIRFTLDYELKKREKGSSDRNGFGKEDVIYLIMPDRFSNGDPGNDSVPGMLEGANRANPNGRHGGDLKGIREELDYIADLGVTALWLNPVLENNMPAYSYHGYAITDFYRVDPRIGTNEEYKILVDECHERGLKIIMDMVFNHCGDNHFWIKDLPSENWINQFPEFTKSNFRIETAIDPYASDFDRQRMVTGWFDTHMPDLNHHNEILAEYLIQNSIWWIEYAGLDGIRMDTYPYSYKDFMERWMGRVLKEYPNFNVVGETWVQKESHTAFFQMDSPASLGHSPGLPSVTDFPMQYAIKDAFNEKDGWTNGLTRLYYVLSQDFMYADPFMNVIFADNHDLTRFYTSIGENFNKYKMAMAVLLTTRGIPMIYYGTEYLMTGEEHKGHGFIREDFPGGKWQSAASPEGEARRIGSQQPEISSQQEEALKYMTTILNWRKGSDAIRHGRLKQFIPQDGIYVYSRFTENTTVLVVINKNAEIKNLNLTRFKEVIGDYKEGEDIVNGIKYFLQNELAIPAETALILELQ